MPGEVFKLFGTIALNSQDAEKGLDELEGKARKTEGVLGKLGKAGAVVGNAITTGATIGAVAVVGLGAASLKMAADFDKGMREVNTLIGGSEDELNSMKAEVLDLSKELGVASGDAVPALYNAISAGVPPENAVAFLRDASVLAIAGVTDLNTAVNGLTTVLNAFQLEASDTSHVSDVLFAGVKAGKTTLDELSDSLFQVAPLANAAGVSLEETVASMAALTLGGTPTTVAATQVRAALQGLLKDAPEVTDAFKAAGYESGQMAIEQVGLAGAMDIVAEAADGDIGMLTKMLGSVEATQAVLALTGSQAEAFATTLEGMENDTGGAQAAFEEMNKSASRQWQIFKNQLNVAMIQFGSMLLPVVTRALQALTPVFSSILTQLLAFARYLGEVFRSGDNLNDFLSEIDPKLQGFARALFNIAMFIKNDFIPTFMTGVRTILPILEELFNFVVTHKPVLIAAIAAIGVAIVLALGPGAAAVAAIIGIITLIGLVKDNWDDLEAFVNEKVNAIKAAIVGAFDSLPDPIKKIMEAVLTDIKAKIAGIQETFQGIVQIIKGVIQLVDALFHGDWKRAWDALKSIAEGVIRTMLGTIRTLIGNIPGIILSIASAAYSMASIVARRIVEGFMNELRNLPSRVRNIVSQVLNALNPLNAASSVVGVDLNPFNAEGTRNWRGGLTWVGERGPELVYIPGGADIFSNEESLGIVRERAGEGESSGGSSTAFNFVAQGSAEWQIRAAFEEFMRRWYRTSSMTGSQESALVG